MKKFGLCLTTAAIFLIYTTFRFTSFLLKKIVEKCLKRFLSQYLSCVSLLSLSVVSCVVCVDTSDESRLKNVSHRSPFRFRFFLRSEQI
ncbi:electron transfer subunit,Dihydroorotate dehydrogenase B (NAD(+)) [Trichinella spiralis]|uniref:Electron transfer subunit,Dihydroorotate dehydrogenase B (NAD(+)) n=1 Tax=Trichinella spiralis TaxID=6334 RepID=A0ABR3K436_TRISP